ncbi:MAG: terpene cyclase/mutase family protein [Ardenticatenales bacterium]|nr:terpene cyclase/mutase family protein [Ardenticatenales bacterium]
MKQRVSILFALFLLLVTALPGLAKGDVRAATAWLKSQVRADGGFSDGFSDASGVGPTVEVVLAAVATDEDISKWGSEKSPLDYLASNAASATTTGLLAKLILTAKATGQDPRNFGGVNLVERLQAQYDSSTGLYKGVLTEHAYAMLALKQAGETIPPKAAEALIGFQDDAGGWSFDGTGQADTNTTALAIQALVAAREGPAGVPISKALTFLKTQQNTDGGFAYQMPSEFGTESDANSTAWVIQGLIAANQKLDDWKSPQEYLGSLQTEEGAFLWKSEVEGANFLATAQALPALQGVTLVTLPTVLASKAPAPMAPAVTAPAAGNAATPGALPTAGSDSSPWGALTALGLLLLLLGGGGLLRRTAR